MTNYMILHFAFHHILCFFSVYIGTALASKYSHQSEICNPTELNKLNGLIMSPNYPMVYPNHTSCTWVINAPPEGVVKIR
jgi:hypothetical protein